MRYRLLFSNQLTGPRPDAGIALAAALLESWLRYRRALELLVARCGPLGARVEAARQELLSGPAVRGSGGTAAALTIPHVSLCRALPAVWNNAGLHVGVTVHLKTMC